MVTFYFYNEKYFKLINDYELLYKRPLNYHQMSIDNINNNNKISNDQLKLILV